MNIKNVFTGENAIVDFLDPGKSLPTPLVELPKQANPYHSDGVRIYAKLLNMLPLSNVKSVPAFNMLKKASDVGKLKGVGKIVENSSGNTVLSLAVLARIFGVKKTKALVSHEISPGKLKLLRLFGTDIDVNIEPICPDPLDKKSGIYKAKKMGERKGQFNAGQYENEENPKAHQKWTAKQIWEQLNGKVDVFCSGLGTTGTLVGCSRFLKKKGDTNIVGVIRSPNNQVPGVRSRGLLNMIAFEWEKHTDFIEEVGTEESYRLSLELIRQGLVVGPSSGFALAGLLKFLRSIKKQGKLNDLRGKNGEINCVFICCDSPYPYIDEYFSYLDESNFPKVNNEDLLLEKPINAEKATKHYHSASPEETYGLIYKEGKKELSSKIEKGEPIKIKKNLVIIDTRSKSEFEHFHIVGSKNVEFRELLSNEEKYLPLMKKEKVIFVCNQGVNSDSAARFFGKRGVNAYTLLGGLTEWSRQNLPRWKPRNCFE